LYPMCSAIAHLLKVRAAVWTVFICHISRSNIQNHDFSRLRENIMHFLVELSRYAAVSFHAAFDPL